MGDRELLYALTHAPRDSIVLIEDVDCALGSRTNSSDENGDVSTPAIRRNGVVYQQVDQRSKGGVVTLSGLLNAIDGVAAQEGRLLFMTTNHREQLDPALIRPGRVDVQCCLQNATKSGAGELFDQFFIAPNSPTKTTSDSVSIVGTKVRASNEGSDFHEAKEAFLAEVKNRVHSYATLQGVLMEARDDPNQAAECMRTKVAATEAEKNKSMMVKDADGAVEEGDLHSHVICDGCSEKGIFGPRYKCKTCPNYDLCKSCYEKKAHKDHPFMLVNKDGSVETLPPRDTLSTLSQVALFDLPLSVDPNKASFT